MHYTMLQNFSKCKVKAARCGNFAILTDFKVSKTAILTSVQALDFDFSEFGQFMKAQFYQNSKSMVSKPVKMAVFEN